MSGTFPQTLPGIKMDFARESIFATKLQESRSGKELATAWWSLPKYRYTVNIEFLRQGLQLNGNYSEMATLVNFYEAQKGQYDIFQFTDPYNGTVQTCRFEADAMEFARDGYGIWTVKTMRFRTVK